MNATLIRQAGPMGTDEFDPLVEFYGQWTMELAERYLPIPGIPVSKYECWNGRLYMAPAEAAQNSYGAAKMIRLLAPGAEAADFYIYNSINLSMGRPNSWLQPDLAILRSPETETWVAAEDCLMPIEFVSPSSEVRDKLVKPLMYASVGIPWYMTVELDSPSDRAAVALYRRDKWDYVPVLKVLAGQRFEMTAPFEAAFDPGDLLVR